MNTVTVDSSKKYNIEIGTGLLDNIGTYISNLLNCKQIAILSDSNVWPIYGASVTNSLYEAGYSVCHYVLPAGEKSKNGENYLRILNFLAENKLTRADCIVALGGGVVGDLAGFVAATYMRGIAFIQVPTSLLAMVDSSVGGKTAIDLPAGKNLAGAFYQPDLVLCDLGALSTLPNDTFLDGCTEVIKYGILFDSALFNHLAEFGTAFNREYVVTRCVELKRDIVNKDERDMGVRQLLNLGHTIGHSIESNSNYAISHGKSVAIGTNLIAACACVIGLCEEKSYRKILDVLLRFDLPVMTKYTSKQLTEQALQDKKRFNNTISLVIPKQIGLCEIYPFPIKNLEPFIKAGQEYANNSLSR